MAKEASKEEIAHVTADREYWQSFIKSEEWRLLGWTYRHAATFVSGQHRSLELTKAHIEMLGLDGNTE